MSKFTASILAVILGSATPMPALAQDSDRDTVPDEVELTLGMDPGTANALTLVHDDKSAAEGDRLSDKHRLSPDLTRLYFANVAGDRYAWRLDFAAPFVAPGVVLILYVDADNDLTTGRQDGARGCDVMLTCVNGGFDASIRNDAVACPDRKLRGVIAGSSVYLSMDVKLKQLAGGRSEWRAWGLCHLAEPNNADQDTTAVFTVQGPGETQRVKPRVGVASELRSEHMRVATPWLGWRRDLRAMKALTLDTTTAALQGMRHYDRALVPERPRSQATLPSPVAGRYHVGIVVQDSAAAAEELLLRVRGRQLGKLVCLQNDGVFHLFTCAELTELRRGDPIELVAAEPAQDFQISEVLLCPRVPEAAPLRIENVAAYCPPPAVSPAPDTVSVDICFTTNLPCSGLVRWGAGTALTAQTPPEATAGYNHRVRLEGLRAGAQYSAQVALAPGWGDLAVPPIRFTAAPLAARTGTATLREVPLQVSDALAEGRPTWPVDGGVPLAPGELASPRSCRLLDASGKAVAAQFRTLGVWPDGSVKWLLASFVHPAGAARGYTLQYGSRVTPGPAPAAPVGLTPGAPGETLVTCGRLRYTLSSKAFSAPGLVQRDTDGDGTFETTVATPTPGLTLTDAAGRKYTSAAGPCELTVEEPGPVRAVVRAEGKLTGPQGALMTWRCRLYFYAGFEGVPAVVTLLNDEGTSVSPPTLTPITSLALPLAAGAAPAAAPRRWLQDDAGHFVTEEAGQRTGQDGHAASYATLGGCTVAIRDFWQLYPKGFSVEGNTLTAELLPQLPADQYRQYTDPKLLTQHYYWCRDGKYRVPMGVALSSDVLFSFAPDAAQAAAAWQAPVLLAAAPQQYCASGAFGEVLPEQPGSFDSFTRYVRDGFDGVEAARQRGQEYSFLDYGDWYGERSVNWGNQEYDLQWGLLLAFARSGELRFFDRAVQAARHTVAVDLINAAPTPDRVGIQLMHCLGHTGGFGMARVPGAEYWFEGGGYNSGHMWSQGTYTAYCLTGDRRYFEGADRLAQWLAGPYLRGFEYYVHRNYGWPTVAVMGGYNVTANPYYLNAARLFTDYVICKQDPGTGVLAHPIGECSHKPLHMGGKVFMSGAVMTGMKMLDRVCPGDELKQAITRNCDWMASRMWHPRDNSFQYAQCPDFDNSSTHAGTYEACEGLAYAYDLTKKPLYRELLERSLADAIRRGPARFGKEYAMQIRMSPFAVSALQRWGLKEFPPLPVPEPRVGFDSLLYLTEQPAQLVGSAENLTGQPLQVTVRLLAVPAGMQVNATAARWEVPAVGVSTRGLFDLTGKPATAQPLKLEYEVAGKKQQAEVVLRPAELLTLGGGLGCLGSTEDPVGQAYAKLGTVLPRLEDLKPETLGKYGRLIVGTEAHLKDYAGLRGQPERLLDFVYSGGHVAVFQLQDSNYRAHYLPYPLAVSDTDSACRDLVAPTHPLFTTPQRVESLRGLMSYDTITYADPRWTVLAKDGRNGPAILECRFGRGKLLVVQPSPDRYVIGQLAAPDSAPLAACAGLLANVLAWLQQP